MADSGVEEKDSTEPRAHSLNTTPSSDDDTNQNPGGQALPGDAASASENGAKTCSKTRIRPIQKNHDVDRAVPKAREKRRRSSLGSLNGLVPLREYTGSLEPIDSAITAKRPSEEKPTDVFVYVLFKKIRNIDVKSSSVALRFLLLLQWETPFAGKAVDESKLWTPRVDILNNDKLVEDRGNPVFFPSTGEVRQLVTFDGNASNEMDLAHFPWDFDGKIAHSTQSLVQFEFSPLPPGSSLTLFPVYFSSSSFSPNPRCEHSTSRGAKHRRSEREALLAGTSRRGFDDT